MSKSGGDTRSGFKNLSKSRLNLIGSISVIFNKYANKHPAPDPRPGPTTTPFFLAQFTKSQTIRK